MFRCPDTGSRLIKARAGGGTLWYSSSSDGRMLTLATARHFFGSDKTREIWVRSAQPLSFSEKSCPSCQKSMRITSLPAWISSSTIEVCRVCRIFWIDSDKFNEIPRGSELLHERGDSTLARDLGEAYVEHNKIKTEKEQRHSDGPTDKPESTVETLLTFLRLPIERSFRPTPEWPIISGLTLALMIVIHAFFTDDSLINRFGFYPNDLFKNFGFNIFSHVFLHGGWFHLISNCYFTYILTDDVEDDLGSQKFIFFLSFVVLVGATLSSFISGGGDIPHIGYSGVVMSLFAYYGLQFPKAKMIWLLPDFRFTKTGTFHSGLFGWSWFQFRTLWVALFYLAGDLFYYFIEEVTHQNSVSFSGHIAGFAAGALFWFLFAPKNFEIKKTDFLEKKLDSLIEQDSEIKFIHSSKAEVKQIE